MLKIVQTIARELSVSDKQVAAAVLLLDEGSTVPFIARYRKEMTGGLSDDHLRVLADRLEYLRELEKRREAILESIQEQGKLTEDLKKNILSAETKVQLEDLYLPYKPKRRTKAQIAREAGLEPLAEALLKNPALKPEEAGLPYVQADKGVPDLKSALEGAREILMERFSEDASLLGELREKLWQTASLSSKVIKGKNEEGVKFSDYFDYREALMKIPSHRALALLRGRQEGILRLTMEAAQLDEEPSAASRRYCEEIARRFGIESKNRPSDPFLFEAVRHCWEFKIFLHLQAELMIRIREAAEAEAIRVFAENLKNLLLASPAGARTTLGLDPGFRTGTKAAVIDKTGKVLATETLYPHPPQNEREEAMEAVIRMTKKYQIELIAIGNGTASRETDRFVIDTLKECPELKVQKIVVSEAGASVYSASEMASAELPGMDVSLRGAVSIARRLQDPLAELVKIDPKAIGVGQYQHDVNQTRLGQMLHNVVEDCVNAVGVDVNTASVSLLSYISGLSARIAKSIVEFRNEKGSFKSRSELESVPGVGPKIFEQAAGFLRITGGTNPLDMSAVHPESYPVVEKILTLLKTDVKALIGNRDFLKKINPRDFVDEKVGLPTVTDILSELEKPGRDPRPEFKTASFKDGVETMDDLKPGMVLEGVITNVTNFGAFVDIGVHRDGLVHISELASRFVKDPHEVAKTGQIVKVRVLEVDKQRQRITLSLRLDASAPARSPSSRNASAPPAPASKPAFNSIRIVSSR